MKESSLESIRYVAAKASQENNELWLPIWMHSNDAAGVMEYLLDNWVPSTFIGKDMDKAILRKTAVFLAAIHDIGKITPVFQNKISDKLPLINEKQQRMGISARNTFSEEEGRNYGNHALLGGLLLIDHGVNRSIAVVVASHHGMTPPNGYSDKETSSLALHQGLFYAGNKDAWQRMQSDLFKWALQRAGIKSESELPFIGKETQLLLTGLLITADWLASTTSFFPLIPVNADAYEQYYPARSRFGEAHIAFPHYWEPTDKWKNGDIIKQMYGFEANSVQNMVQQIAGKASNPGLYIIEAPMGNGKTEASLAMAEILAQRFCKAGLAFFLPSQATSNAIFTRLIEWSQKQTNGERLSIQLAHGSFLLNDEFEDIRKEAEEGQPELTVNQFFCGSKSFLLANIVVGTIDQLLMTAIKQKHVMLKHLGLDSKVVIIDECHAYDAYMNVYLDRVLKYLAKYNVPVILLSATLPARRRVELLEAYTGVHTEEHALLKEESYPLISWSDSEEIKYSRVDAGHSNKEITIDLINDDEIFEIVNRAVSEKACVGIIVNTVNRAQTIKHELDNILKAHPILYHSQFLLPDRITKEQQIISRIGKKSGPDDRKGIVIVGTQVLEQSLDIDFDLLITDLCPMDLLLQRIGRLHRHNRVRPQGYDKAKCLILSAKSDELENGARAIYGDYLLKRTLSLLPKTISIPKDIASLVQKTYKEVNIVENEFAKEYEEFLLETTELRSKAQNFLLPEITESRRSIKTIEGLMDKNDSITEESARATVRNGTPAVEVIVLKKATKETYEILSGDMEGTTFSADRYPETKLAKEIAKQKIRLPHRLCNKRTQTSLLNELRRNTDEKMGKVLQSPWVKDELFLLLDDESNTILLDKYKIHYDGDDGLMVNGEEE